MKRIRRYLTVLAGLAGTALAIGTAAPAALAYPAPPDPTGPAVVPAAPLQSQVVTGGMAGWQIALIAIGAALFAAAAAVLVDRAWAARRRMTTAT